MPDVSARACLFAALLAFDPARASAAAIAAEANRRLARSRTRLSLLRVGRPGSGLAPD